MGTLGKAPAVFKRGKQGKTTKTQTIADICGEEKKEQLHRKLRPNFTIYKSFKMEPSTLRMPDPIHRAIGRSSRLAIPVGAKRVYDTPSFNYRATWGSSATTNIGWTKIRIFTLFERGRVSPRGVERWRRSWKQGRTKEARRWL